MRVIFLAGLVLACLAPATAQEAPKVARTPDGRPDLQGVWTTRFITRLERPREAKSLEVSPEEAKVVVDAMLVRSNSQKVTDPDFAFYGFNTLASVKGKLRTSLIVDPPSGKIPYSPAGVERADAFNDMESYGFDNPEERPAYERCLSGILAPPIRLLPMLMPTQIVQTPNALVFTNEDVQGLRIVSLSGPTAPAAVRPFDGISRARWDGDTLLIETSDFRADDVARPDMGPPIVLRAQTRITERFTRTSHDELLYEYLVEDSELYTQPWRVEFVMTLEKDEVVYEYACHECNHSMVGMLMAGRLGYQERPTKKIGRCEGAVREPLATLPRLRNFKRWAPESEARERIKDVSCNESASGDGSGSGPCAGGLRYAGRAGDNAQPGAGRQLPHGRDQRHQAARR